MTSDKLVCWIQMSLDNSGFHLLFMRKLINVLWILVWELKVKILVAQSCLTLCNSKDCSLPGWDSLGKNTSEGSHSLLQGSLPNPGIKPRSPALQTDSLPSEPPGKPSLLICTMGRYSLFNIFTSMYEDRESTAYLSNTVVMIWQVRMISSVWKWKWKLLSCVRLFETPWTIESMDFSRPEYWSG